MNVAVVPVSVPPIEEAITAAGGVVTGPEVADAIVWMDTSHPEDLAATLAKSPARWVQMPFAGIERFFQAGVIDESRTWTCAKGIYGHATAEHALTLLLASARKLHRHIRSKAWVHGSDERRLAGSTVLIVGTGGIGSALIDMLKPMNVNVLTANRRSGNLAQLVPDADFIVLCAALTKETTGLFNDEMFARMKDGAWIVNVARGPMISTDSLLGALNRIGGAALDVTDPEPLPDDHPLWTKNNVIITSHTANTAAMAVPELAAMVRRNVEHFIKGEPLEGLVDPKLGY